MRIKLSYVYAMHILFEKKTFKPRFKTKEKYFNIYYGYRYVHVDKVNCPYSVNPV